MDFDLPPPKPPTEPPPLPKEPMVSPPTPHTEAANGSAASVASAERNAAASVPLAPPVLAAPIVPVAPIPPPAPAVLNGASPIADLTYRNYDGPLKNRAIRWWIIAAANIRMTLKKPGFWVLFATCCLPYLIQAFALYFQFQLEKSGLGGLAGGGPRRRMGGGPPGGGPGGPGGQPLLPFVTGEKFAIHFFQALTGDVNSLALFGVALLSGAGSIASDNRANALMVYLSKPITKGDYLLGKWAGVFLTVFGVALVPGVLFYLYCLASYANDGLLKDEPLLFLRVIAAAAVPAAIHTSLLIGCSAWSKTSRLAGATYAGIYFLTAMAAGFVLGPLLFSKDAAARSMVQHSSISGVIDGLCQNIYKTRTTGGLMDVILSQGQQSLVEMPALWLMLTLAALMLVGGVAAARAKIRAVEVVRG